MLSSFQKKKKMAVFEKLGLRIQTLSKCLQFSTDSSLMSHSIAFTCSKRALASTRMML